MRWRSVLYFAVIGLVASSGPAFADGGQTYLGQTTAASPTFTRPSGGGPGLGQVVHYQTQEFELSLGTGCFFYGQQSHDGYLHLYSGTFNPLLPLTNLVAGDDDGDLGIGTSQLENLDLVAGHYILVNSAFNSFQFGTFSTTVHCATDLPPIGGPCNGFFISGIPFENTICLNNRFIVGIDSVSNSTIGGLGVPVRFGSNDTGLFWFYSPTNFEVMVKVLDGCGINNRWWVFAGALTDQAYRLLIGDTKNAGLGLKVYSNPQGTAAPAINDTNAFATCP